MLRLQRAPGAVFFRGGLPFAICYLLLAIGYWLLAIGYWLLAIGYSRSDSPAF